MKVSERRIQAERLTAMTALFDETRSLFHRLRAAAAALHGAGEDTAAHRGVLTELSRLGPRSVPEMARSRPVSRQHIQLLVNALASKGLVRLQPNPAHKRSALVALTPRGCERVERMAEREARALTRLDLEVRPDQLRLAVGVLRQVRQALARARWDAAGRSTRRKP